MAQDTGGAIRGAVRADFFWGFDMRRVIRRGACGSDADVDAVAEGHGATSDGESAQEPSVAGRLRRRARQEPSKELSSELAADAQPSFFFFYFLAARRLSA